ncbi:hypothetical protein BKP37_18895 [Anaerobacillus alkalilacustris]|uniref:Uncharacterized protein n=1 Tax=Anaerobacillus alkalilacustris TaxID=393763 RepID=A0A1S2LED7_9BACI|nr:tetratricopeptide repeat protein [Anaerobacillus alkalilacustris]OIJ10600.1 hypothetical protein BKP37_18895 [Anaerobacillus alkalilacustris]
MREKQKKFKEKVVLFPGVVEKLVAKGMEALKQKSFSDAFSFFDQALQIEPDHPQARFGLALSLIEQARLEEAKEVTEQMLKEDVGNYYDILQVHISLLVQLGEYDEVVTMLEGIMTEEKLPANLAESFYHLLHFSRQMVDDGTNVEIDIDIKQPPEEVLNMLYNGTVEKQWLAIQMLGKLPASVFIEAVKQYLMTNHFDPVLKSIILQQLKEKNVIENIEIHKFGKVININISELEDVYHEEFGQNTLKLVAEQLENDNPSLFEVVTQLWWHYLFAIYPISPEPLQPSLWAAAVHRTGIEMAGMDFDDYNLANKYNVDKEEMVVCSEEILKIENETYKGIT